MGPTRIDFAVPPARASRRGIVLLVLGVACAGAAVVDDAHRGDEVEQTLSRLERVRTAAKRAHGAQAMGPRAELAAFRRQGDIARRLGLPWGELLDALERADNGNVALLTVEPDAERGRLRLAGEARTPAALVGYIGALEGRAGIADMRLVTQQIKPSDPQQPIEFMLESNWLRRAPSPATAAAAVSEAAPAAGGVQP